MRRATLLAPVLLLVAPMLLAPTLLAQGTRSDYERARGLAGATRDKVFRARVQPRWLPGGGHLWYRVRTGPGAWEHVLVDVEAGERRRAFDPGRLAAALSKETGREQRPESLAVDDLGVVAETGAISFRAAGARWEWDDASGELRRRSAETGEETEHRAPRRPRPSRRTGEEVYVSFVNRLERDGWNHLWLHDGRTGEVRNQITKGEWVVRGVDRVDEESRRIWFRAGGIRPGQDPYHIHHCRVGFDGTGLVVLTEGDGTHSIEHSPDGRHFVDTWSRVDLPPVTELRRSEDGSLVCELERADATALLATGWRMPERFVAKGRDGVTDIHGVIFRPTTFDPGRKYPIIEDIYAGPHGSFTPRSFRALHSAQTLAELGFAIVKLDGLGTSHRSKRFHDVAWKNLGDSGFPDRIAWIRAAAERYPCLDTTRVGIFGGSAGGQSALRALLAHGDAYHVAVADCGCHDNRMDKIWWNELWMGWPVGPHYEEQSNVTQAHRLQGKLLLIVGEKDENVDPSSTLQVVDALIRADRDFDFILMTGRGHGAAETPYGRRRRADFFVRHLLGVEPRTAP